ncbi:adenine nucleotide alpha hydrolase [candidate division FCPU426 bacterium]|nr:adenine nucleotide alpha hydrolase [candidate division FCPU426 bacterium]
MSTQKTTAWLAWSSGKDSAWALHILRQQGKVRVTALVTTISKVFHRVSMHGVRESLLGKQAKAIGLPLIPVYLPHPCTQEDYAAAMSGLVQQAARQGVRLFAFGDIFLEDVRQYREMQLRESGCTPLFPLWGQNTQVLAREMINQGLRAYITCLDPQKLPPALAGSSFDHAFIQKLPSGVDPCGENGEFHSFVCAGPMFSTPLGISPGVTLQREGFFFTDLQEDNGFQSAS